ncbi:MAG: hypothetical protein UW94_C0012G0015 [Parcubacteria group bacterium GW2011_GWA2_45_14]|nr:MAG: hypothetical protein UW94_C0012G0015 [Parcubacteria group bacterium GW2011_GWA2_45_14]
MKTTALSLVESSEANPCDQIQALIQKVMDYNIYARELLQLFFIKSRGIRQFCLHLTSIWLSKSVSQAARIINRQRQFCCGNLGHFLAAVYQLELINFSRQPLCNVSWYKHRDTVCAQHIICSIYINWTQLRLLPCRPHLACTDLSWSIASLGESVTIVYSCNRQIVNVSYKYRRFLITGLY